MKSLMLAGVALLLAIVFADFFATMPTRDALLSMTVVLLALALLFLTGPAVTRLLERHGLGG